MSSTISTEDPAFYAELLMNLSRPANRRLLPDEQSCSSIPGIQGVDGPLARRLQTLLDDVAAISRCQRKNVCATMTCLKDKHGTLETQLYIVFNHENDETARCTEHLQSIFDMLRRVPSKPPAMGDSPKDIAEELQIDFLEFCKTIHNYSFPIFAHRVTKRKPWLSKIQGYVEQDQRHFSFPQRSTLMAFLEHVDGIIELVDDTKATKQLSIADMRYLMLIYSYWTDHDLLPKDPLAKNKMTILDLADSWLADEHDIHIDLRRWALKIMSFYISASSLFTLIQSRRLRKFLDGRFLIEVLPSPTTTPYRCDLSRETVSVALDAALAGTSYVSADPDHRESFIKSLLAKPEDSNVDRKQPRVHAELAMIMAMVKGEVKDVEPYIGVFKLSCIMCSHYIHAFDEVTEQKISTRGSHGKAYAGWFWPSLPSHDGELVPKFLRRIKQQLLSDFKEHVESHRRLADSSVGSGGARVNVHPTEVEIREARRAARRLTRR